ncbi:MAG: hypothetical protein ACYTGW_22935 [Planctomycetota bacterium]|jgi:hypothetical protein
MRSTLLLALGLATMSTGLVAQTTYKLNPIDSVSVAPNSTTVWRDNRHRAYTGSGTTNQLDIHGLLKFDLTKIPDTAVFTSMKLTCTLENAFGSPRNNPVVNLHYSADDKWTRATATPTSGKLGAILTANQKNFKLPTHVFTINIAAHNWAIDLKDNFLTLAIDNVNTAYSYVYFFGAKGTPTGTPPLLEIVTGTGTCNGSATPFGTGGKDSTNTTVTAVLTRCPQIGNVIGLGANFKANAPMTVWVGLQNQTWLNQPLPHQLGMYGGGNNSVYISLDVPLGSRTGPGTVPGVIPNNAIFKGFTFYAQAVIYDNANPLGIVTGPGQMVTVSN